MADDFDKLAFGSGKPSCPVGVQVQLLCRLGQYANAGVIERPDDCVCSVYRRVFGDYDLDVLVRLPENGGHAFFDVPFTVENRDDNGNQGLSAQRLSD